MKICTGCEIEKNESEFYKRKASKDGLTASCKSCLSDYDKGRANLPHRVAARKQYQKTDNYANSHDKATKKYRESYPNKYKAHNMVNNAIRCRNMRKWPCEQCGKNAHAHHDDYLYPLTVRWLCPAHHRKWHKENGEGLNAK